MIGRSTTLQVIRVLDVWTQSADVGNEVDVIYMDFQKAFETVPHIRLVQNLKTFGIGEIELRWVKSFLENWKLQVCINGKKSTVRRVTSGVSQESVLRPVLLVMYINDLPNMVKSDVCLFADDTKIFRPIRNIEDQKTLQDVLLKLQNWSDNWLLIIHPDKCKVMSLSSSARNPSNNKN